jgi:hypothetical protein
MTLAEEAPRGNAGYYRLGSIFRPTFLSDSEASAMGTIKPSIIALSRALI